jgi:hypothetical protein
LITKKPLGREAETLETVTKRKTVTKHENFVDTYVYRGTLVHMKEPIDAISIERIQTGVRIEKGLLKVLKALAELKDMSLGDLLEGIVLHAFEGKAPFSPATLEQIDQFRKIYGVTLRATDSHRLKERK